MIKTIGIIGANGKLGKAIVEEAVKNHQVITVVRGEKFSDKVEQADIWIDASDNNLAIEHIETSTKPIIICTTGENMTYEGKPKVPIMFAPNTSLAFAQIRKLLKALYDWNVVIGDVHFHTKKDTPSGTTKEIMSFMKNVNGHYSFRNNIIGAKMQFNLDNMDEIIEISYTTFNRSPYAQGALKLAAWLVKQPPKTYIVENFVQSCE